MKDIESSKNKTKESDSRIADKILHYKNHLDAVPIKLISLDESEIDRKEVNSLYNQTITNKHLQSPASQLLDSKFYHLLVNMNRERDKQFLREGTTRKERLSILSKIILRVTTPMLVLNQRRVIELFDQTFFGNKNFYDKKMKSDNGTTYKDPEMILNVPEFSEEDIKQIKNRLMSLLDKNEWNSIEEVQFCLNHWEADILSQMARDNELLIEINNKTGLIKLKKNSGNVKFNNTFLILLEPKK